MRLLFVIDAPGGLDARSDSTVALMRAAARRGDEVFCAELHDLRVRDGEMAVRAVRVLVSEDDAAWMRFGEGGARGEVREAGFFEAILVRKEPPVDEAFVMATRLLDVAARRTRVVNAPRALRECNEKLLCLAFPDLIPPTWVGACAEEAGDFWRRCGTVVLKPLNGMGGAGVYVCAPDDLNFRSVFGVLSGGGRRQIMAQGYLAAAREGDFRVFAVNGEVLPMMLARVPRADDHRGNMAVGGRAQAMPLDAAAARIGAAVAPELRRRGILFAGLDVIGGRLIEVNITCPTGLRVVRDQTGCAVDEAVLGGMV